MQISRLYTAVDGSHASLEAARMALDLASQWKCSVRAVYVVEPEAPDGAIGAETTAARLRDSGRSILARIVELGRQKKVAVETRLLEGVPFEAILADARAWKADIIVMGRTGRTGPGRALLGTEAERVLEFADRPVVIVPASEAPA